MISVSIFHRWLFSCATSGYKVPEEDHLVSLKAQQSVLHSKPSANAETNIITPFKPIQPSLSTTVGHAISFTFCVKVLVASFDPHVYTVCILIFLLYTL